MKIVKLSMSFLTGIVYLCIIAYLAIAAPLVLGFHPVVVLSGSMEPAYKVGSIIYYKAAPFEEIQVGDPITFQNSEDGVMVTHRVAEKHETEHSFETAGDANGSRDPGTVPYDNVIGKASPFCIPYAGYFVSAGKQPAAIAAMVLVLLAGIAVDKILEEDAGKGRRS